MKPTRVLLLITALLVNSISGKLVDVTIINKKDSVQLKEYMH